MAKRPPRYLFERWESGYVPGFFVLVLSFTFHVFERESVIFTAWSIILKWDGFRLNRCCWQHIVLSGIGAQCCHNIGAAGSLVCRALMIETGVKLPLSWYEALSCCPSPHLFTLFICSLFFPSKLAFLWSLENTEGNLEGFCLIRCICGFTWVGLTVEPWELVIKS